MMITVQWRPLWVYVGQDMGWILPETKTHIGKEAIHFLRLK